LTRFLDELRQSIQTSLPGADFFEDRETRVGTTWNGDLLKAAGTCQALLSIYSPRYFNNGNCGRVFEMFRWRIKRAGEHSLPIIFPVIWEPVRGGIPEIAREFQFAPPGFPKEYLAEGLRYLAKLRLYRTAYHQFVEYLGQAIGESLQRSALPPAADHSPQQIENAFRSPTDSGVNTALFSFAVGTASDLETVRDSVGTYGDSPSEWRPFELPIGIVALQAASEAKLLFREIPLRDCRPTEFLERLKSATANLEPLILLVDPWSMGLEPIRSGLLRYDSLTLPTTAVVVPWMEHDPETHRHRSALQSILHETLRFRTAAPESAGLFRNARSQPELRSVLVETLTKLRLKRIEHSVATKVIAPNDVVFGQLPVIGFPREEV
jgi:FxsC-like protein